MPDVPAWLVVIGAMIGYALSFGQNRIARRANDDTVTTAAGAEIMGTYRWAAEWSVDTDEGKRQVGIRTLWELAQRPDVTTDDKKLIKVALDVSLASLTVE